MTKKRNYALKFKRYKSCKVQVFKMNLETPECYYSLPAVKLIQILTDQDLLSPSDLIKTASILTLLRKYEDYSIIRKPKKEEDDTIDVEQTAPPFKEKVVNALFWIPGSKKSGEKGKYKYLRVKLKPSSIKAAGIGAYAVDLIPKGAKGVYKGVPKKEKYTNMYYSWVIKTFDLSTGEADQKDKPLHYVDATDLTTSNWTRYVNCGLKNKSNNFEPDQVYDKVFYVATKNIHKNEELFIDYGEAYREDNLQMTGKY